MTFDSVVERFYHELVTEGLSNSDAVTEQFLCADVKWSAAHPVNDVTTRTAVLQEFLAPLLTAMPDLERKPLVMLSDREEQSIESTWIDSTGYIVGTFEQNLFDIPATQRTLYLRYTEMVRIENEKIAECYIIPDFIDAMHQAGVNPLRPSLGHPGLVMGPTTQDGLGNRANSTNTAEAEESAKSRQLVLDMLDCLGRFDGRDLASMDLENYWHPDFMWYGPGGIGTTRGIEGFRRDHQGPFVHSFPDRSVDTKINLLACGNYVATGGWPHMTGTHSAGEWLGLAPTNKELTLRVMDIWRREGDLLKENWVAIDIVDMLMQMGLDVFEQMRELQL